MVAALAVACAPGREAAPWIRAPAIVDTTGPLDLHVQYPAEDGTIGASDSTFVFGAVRGVDPGSARVTVNGARARLHAGGGWLAFVPVEPGPFVFDVHAAAGDESATVERAVTVAEPAYAPGPDSLPYRPGSIVPVGPLELYAGDTLRVAVVAAPEWKVTARLGRAETPLKAVSLETSNWGRRVWGDDDPVERSDAAPWAERAARAVRERAAARGRWVEHAADVFLRFGGAGADSLSLLFEGPGGERLVAPVAGVTFLDPTDVRVAVLDDDTAGTGRTDHRVIARTRPAAGYQLMPLNGTVAPIARRIGRYRELALGPGTSAWVSVGEVFEIPGPKPIEHIAVVRTRETDGWSELVLPIEERLPFRLEQRLDPVRYTIDVYGLISNVDWIETAADERWIESVRWSQPFDGVFRLDVDLAGDQAWGWRAYWEGTHLVIGFRHAPDALAGRRYRSPLHGVRVVVDPGHNPGTGAVGPTGLEEREANLAIALALEEILRERGAEVVMTRATADSALGLYDRTNLAVEADGELFVSIHNNALPDGVNPFVHNGTSVLFYHPQAEPLAEAIQAELLPRTGLKDHGVWHQNIAVGRMNEMPAVLVESAFMMIPEQEAALRTEAFQREIALGVAEGIERFLRERGRPPVAGPTGGGR